MLTSLLLVPLKLSEHTCEGDIQIVTYELLVQQIIKKGNGNLIMVVKCILFETALKMAISYRTTGPIAHKEPVIIIFCHISK